MNTSCHQLLTGAGAAAREAGRYALVHGGRRGEVAETRRHDVKLKLDRECQEIAEAFIRAHFPTHDIMGEEDATEAPVPAASEFRWIIDPIDGTVNFSHGLPHWCCSIAVERRGTIVAGAVYAPVTDELYTASLEQAAQCNGAALHVSTVTSLDRALVLTGVDKDGAPGQPPFERFLRITDRVQRSRIMGCAALDICHVAAGRADAYFESGIYTWDMAAAALIVQQAGGRGEILARRGGHRLCFAATNGRVHQELKDLLAFDT